MGIKQVHRPVPAVATGSRHRGGFCDRRFFLARISHHGYGLRGAAPRVAVRRPPAASLASTVASATLFGPLLAVRLPDHDAGRSGGEKCGLGWRRAGTVRP